VDRILCEMSDPSEHSKRGDKADQNDSKKTTDKGKENTADQNDSDLLTLQLSGEDMLAATDSDSSSTTVVMVTSDTESEADKNSSAKNMEPRRRIWQRQDSGREQRYRHKTTQTHLAAANGQRAGGPGAGREANT